ncbi:MULTISPECIES: tripartite tricarboxylate transporter substrate-binding protein [unclassified Beijerinckia]|uniref:tripartite tricarboxylate transporter substrate-binding protein n=1 Tax=unclassified Beijerinckia TaxID=2638183 RepID=UPI00089A03A0|nr:MULTISPECIES: tripartite tricarboxylate transporter substrate-binding protein [unclassified Beijerinckia]MDH7797946.1 tripartite-type tricarboxylate transporter receptor subunit TctC [Beijerinckia sp. GAS462]SED03650.1 Tripartite-type tricarboxylate transporter, receptor component TctC [Beijerinckia sp. 28-YEA-48]
MIRVGQTSVLAGLLTFGLAASSATSALSQEQKDYAGRQIRFVSTGGPGGAFDTYMRTLIPPMEKYLNATLLPTYELLGLAAIDRVVNAPKDGSTIVLLSGEGMMTSFLYKMPGVRYDPRKMEWIGRVADEKKVIAVSPTSSFNSLADLVASNRKVLWGSVNNSDSNSDATAVMAYVTDMPAKIVLGYGGSSGVNFALANGEVDGRVASHDSAALFVRAKQYKVLATVGLSRSKMFPDIPTIAEVSPLSDDKKLILEWRANIADLGRVMITTPGTRPALLSLLRKALENALNDPLVVERLKEQQLVPAFANAEETVKLVEKSLTMLDAPHMEQVRKIALERYY